MDGLVAALGTAALGAALIFEFVALTRWRPGRTWSLLVLGFFAVVMIGLFSLQYFDPASAITTALTATTMLAVLARLAFTVRENKHLLDQVRTDQLTGLGNQGRMQVDLATCCRRAED